MITALLVMFSFSNLALANDPAPQASGSVQELRQEVKAQKRAVRKERKKLHEKKMELRKAVKSQKSDEVQSTPGAQQ